MITDPMDDEYIDQVLSGDPEAFGYFIKTYKDTAFNLAVSIVKDDHHAEEVVQEAFVNAFNGLKNFNKKAAFKSWFHRIIVNQSFQHLKKINKYQTLNDEIKHNSTAMPFDMGDSEASDEIVKVQTAMKLLSAKESMLLNLFYLEEYSIKELVPMTGWSTANIKVILHRARKNLRHLLDNKVKS